VTVAADRVPLLEGARESVAQGIFSSLQPQNVRLRRAIRDLDAAARHPLYPLLFDPQTAGGLLAAVPLEQAEDCVSALRAAGYVDACLIGHVLERSEALEPITLASSVAGTPTGFAEDALVAPKREFAPSSSG